MQREPRPFVDDRGVAQATQAGQQLRVPVTFERPLPYVPSPVSLLWTDLENAQYMGAEDVTLVGCTLVWRAERPDPSHVKATVML